MLVRSTNLSQKSFEYPTDWGQGSRGCWSGGGQRAENGASADHTYYITISTPANALLFGSTINDLWRCAGTSGRGRGLISGGTVHNTPTNASNKMWYVTIATPSAATAFGDLVTDRINPGAASNGTRALIMAGWGTHNQIATGKTSIDYVTRATTGAATNFGNLSHGTKRSSMVLTNTATGNGTYAMIMCDLLNYSSSWSSAKYDYIAIATGTGSIIFGGMGPQVRGDGITANSNGTRSIWSGGYMGSWHTYMEYLTWSTLGNALAYGRMQYNITGGSGVEDGSRGVIGGGTPGGNSSRSCFYFSMDLAPGTAVITSNFGELTGSGYSDPGSQRKCTASYAG